MSRVFVMLVSMERNIGITVTCQCKIACMLYSSYPLQGRKMRLGKGMSVWHLFQQKREREEEKKWEEQQGMGGEGGSFPTKNLHYISHTCKHYSMYLVLFCYNCPSSSNWQVEDHSIVLLKFVCISVMAVEDLTDWERCFLWLSRCQVLYEEVDSVHNLAAVLRDGVILCRLINQLRPDTIATKNFSQRPQLSQV